MRSAKLVLVAVSVIVMAGCVLSGKPKPATVAPAPPKPTAPAAPPEPLSIPQTQVQLPAPQPVIPDALNTVTPEEPAPQTPAKPTPPAPRPQRNPAPQPKPPVAAAADTQPPPDQPVAAEPARAPTHEILDEKEQNRLREEAHGNRADAFRILRDARPNKGGNQSQAMREINQFLKQSIEAENAGDMRLANQLAERAHILAKELQSGK